MDRLVFKDFPSLPRAYLRALVARKEGLPEGGSIPRIEALVEERQTDLEHLARYRRLCGFAGDAPVPPSYPQALANALHAEMLLSPTFPIKAIRLIHIGNRIAFKAPLDPHVPWTFSSWIEGHRSVPIGVEIDFCTEVLVKGEAVWRSVSTLLLRQNKGRSKRGLSKTRIQAPEEFSRSTYWKLPESLGRTYSVLSGDFNPIHQHALLAKPFGFKRAIIHGLWSLARCLAELDQDLPAQACELEVTFKKPLYLPSSVHFLSYRQEDDLCFELRSGTKKMTHLVGTIRNSTEFFESFGSPS